jgi:hypothetical protein
MGRGRAQERGSPRVGSGVRRSQRLAERWVRPRPSQPYRPGMRLCQECGRTSSPEAKGWRLCRVDVPEEDPEPQLAAYCSSCATREFGSVRSDDD